MPDTPEDDAGQAAAAAAAAAANPGSGELRRQALKKSAEKARGGAAGTGAAVNCMASAPVAAAAGVAEAAGAVGRDLTNQRPAGASAAQAGMGAGRPQGAPQQQTLQQGAGPPGSAMPPALGAGQPVPLARQQQRQPPQQASFLAGAKAALLEASASGSQPGLHAQQQQQQQLQQKAASALATAAAAGASRQQQLPRVGQVPQLALRRSPHAAAALPGAPVLAGMPAGDPAAGQAPERTPQAQLGLRCTPGSDQVPPTGRTDGGASTISGGCCRRDCREGRLSGLGLDCLP